MSDQFKSYSEEAIRQKLFEIQSRNDVIILYACESGSRAWGFPSADSDYDVRFIYAHRRNWYLRVVPGRDVIEQPINDTLDLGGWDCRKSFSLLRKSNCPLIEWLSSPIVYLQVDDAINPMKNLVNNAFQATTAFYHYLSMAKKKYAGISEGENTRLKDYFYALRATLCCEYIVDNFSAPPMSITPLLEAYVEDSLRQGIENLIIEKRHSTEKDRIQRIPELDYFLQRTLNTIELNAPVNGKQISVNAFNDAFIETINRCEILFSEDKRS